MAWKKELMKAETFHHDDVSVLLEYKYEVGGAIIAHYILQFGATGLEAYHVSFL